MRSRTVRPALLLLVGVLAGRRVEAQDRLAIRSEPGTPVVATEVLVAAGPAQEPAGKAGLAHLAARTVIAPILPTLDSLGAHLTYAAGKDALAFTLISAPDVWEEASRMLMVALFRDPPEERWLRAEREAVVQELIARRSNPADAVIRETDRAVFGEDHPWGRPTVGDAGTVRSIDLRDVDAFLRANVTSSRAIVAVVGPITPEAGRGHLRSFLDLQGPLPDLEVPRPRPSQEPVLRDYNSITTWVAVSYLFPRSADVEALRLLAQLVGDELGFSPTRRSVFNLRAEVFPRPIGSELRFELVTPPGEAEVWAERLMELVERISNRSLLGDALGLRLRRYRGERLLDLASPEARAAELARDLFAFGRPQPLELETLSVERLRAATESLERPVVVFQGPYVNDTD